MADLDDFFAKKDRKKAKAKKFTTADEIAKKMEDPGRKIEKTKKDKMSILSGGFIPDMDDLTGNNEEDEEWKEFKEEKKDYTGLKIQNSNVQDLDDSDNGDDNGDLDDNDSEDPNSKKKTPWKVVNNVSTSDNQSTKEPAALKQDKNQPTAPVQKSYVPPHLRNQPQGRERFGSRTAKKAEAPDITNQKFFPTLTAANNETPSSWNKKKQEAGFEEVRNSKSHSSRNEPVPQSLRIGNKFGALDSDNS